MKLSASVWATAALLLFATPRLAGEPSPARELWPQATAAVDSGDTEGADKKFQELLELGRQLGIRRFPLYADSAASLARQANLTRNHDLSAWAMNAAKKLDPHSPNVSFTAADLARRQGRYPAAGAELFDGMRNLATDYRARTLSSSDMMIVVVFALAATILTLGIALFLRYGRAAAHDFRELVGDRLGASFASIVGFVLLFLPLFLWLGPTWLVLYWFALFFGYATLRERITIAVACLVGAALPILLDFAAYRAAGVSNAVVRSALSAIERSHEPETLRRLRELAERVPDNSDLQLLLGNLEVLDGDEQQASIRYRRAVELNPGNAGAHLNIGNLFFYNNDFLAAMANYEKAAEIRPSMAIAFYNQSVAAGELYRYDLQGQMLEQAKQIDRGLVDRLIASPTPQKVVRYTVPVDEAWRLAAAVAAKPEARELFGNYARFDFARSLLNHVTIAAPLALLIGFIIRTRRGANAFAGACIKCGRTFCPKCKSSRESAIYCTQCIHIYLKRDGVSVDTKRQKLEEVHEYQTSTLRSKKVANTFLPGARHLLEGSTVRGLVIMLLFALVVGLAIFIGRLAPIAYPADTFRLAVRILAIVVAVVIWALAVIPAYRQKAAVA